MVDLSLSTSLETNRPTYCKRAFRGIMTESLRLPFPPGGEQERSVISHRAESPSAGLGQCATYLNCPLVLRDVWKPGPRVIEDSRQPPLLSKQKERNVAFADGGRREAADCKADIRRRREGGVGDRCSRAEREPCAQVAACFLVQRTGGFRSSIHSFAFGHGCCSG